ncbi:hypothetical protein Pcinc_020252 [Petrolisthes cinctipes]|uniref:Uncharacterized protein n=1 Tax=Petrolisthes cinctipes TaxID=88211 RepID=A0AAE1FKK0_PETCI|nr:hypothetical protein Pcinc_020252 [Petrolisthes cinctipes]
MFCAGLSRAGKKGRDLVTGGLMSIEVGGASADTADHFSLPRVLRSVKNGTPIFGHVNLEGQSEGECRSDGRDGRTLSNPLLAPSHLPPQPPLPKPPFSTCTPHRSPHSVCTPPPHSEPLTPSVPPPTLNPSLRLYPPTLNPSLRLYPHHSDPLTPSVPLSCPLTSPLHLQEFLINSSLHPRLIISPYIIISFLLP